MRIAVVSDIHANLTALEAVVADLRRQGTDLIVQGGDVVGGGSRPAEVIDLVRELRWPGVYGNTDEMLWRPERLSRALQAPQLQRFRDAMLTEIIPATCRAIGDERLEWLKALPGQWALRPGSGQAAQDLAVVHASPDDRWRSPLANASNEELEQTFGPLACRRVVFGHIHQPFVRHLPALTIVNSGSVSLSYDGDPRAAYALLDDDGVVIRRVEYDIEEEIARLAAARDPYAEWTAQVLRTGRYVPLP